MEEILIQLDALAKEKEENIQQKVEWIKTDIKNLFHTQNNALSPRALYQEQQQSKEVQQVVNQLLKDNLQWKSCTIKQSAIVHKRQEMFWGQKFNYTWLDIMESFLRQTMNGRILRCIF